MNYLLVILNEKKTFSPPLFSYKWGKLVITVCPVAFLSMTQCVYSPWWWPCANCLAFVSAGRGQRFSGEGKRVALIWIVPLYLEAIDLQWKQWKKQWNENISYLTSFSGVSSGFCLNNRDPHVSGWDVLAERKLWDGCDPWRRDISEGNQGNGDRLVTGFCFFCYLRAFAYEEAASSHLQQRFIWHLTKM